MRRLAGLIALAACLVVLTGGAQGCSSSSSSGSATCCQATNGSVALCACPGTAQGCTVSALGSTCKITCGADSLSGMPMTSCPTPTAQGYVAATMSSAGAGSTCPVAGGAGAFLTIGSGGSGAPTPVADGSNNASVTCMVHPSGSGFDVQLSASMSGGGSLSLNGSVTASGASGVSASFSGPSGGPYTDNNCSVAFTYMGSPVPASPVITAGRIWGHVSCPMAAMGSNACDAEADFLFENCAQ